MTADGSLDDRITPDGVVGPYNFMDGDTASSDEDPDDKNGDSGAGGDLSSDDSSSDGDGELSNRRETF